MINNEKKAIGERGILIRGLGDAIWFRQYDEHHNFVDYEITNYDCEVVIIDPSAALIRTERGNFLDYTTESMGVIDGTQNEIDKKTT
jgi:hypothetical protein